MLNAMSRLPGANAQKHVFASARAHYLASNSQRRRHMLSIGQTAAQRLFANYLSLSIYVFIYIYIYGNDNDYDSISICVYIYIYI